MIVVSVCLPSDVLSQHLSSYLGLLGHGVSLHCCSSKVQLLLLTLDEVSPPDLECAVASLGPPAPVQPPLLGCGVALWAAAPDLWRGVAPLSHASAWTLLNETHIKFYINCDHLHNVYAILFYIVASYSLLLLFPPSISHLHHSPNQSSR